MTRHSSGRFPAPSRSKSRPSQPTDRDPEGLRRNRTRLTTGHDHRPGDRPGSAQPRRSLHLPTLPPPPTRRSPHRRGRFALAHSGACSTARLPRSRRQELDRPAREGKRGSSRRSKLRGEPTRQGEGLLSSARPGIRMAHREGVDLFIRGGTEEDRRSARARDGIPVSRSRRETAKPPAHGREELHKRVVCQTPRSTLFRAIRRTRGGSQDPKRPSGSFIFPRAVGRSDRPRPLRRSPSSFSVTRPRWVAARHVVVHGEAHRVRASSALLPATSYDDAPAPEAVGASRSRSCSATESRRPPPTSSTRGCRSSRTAPHRRSRSHGDFKNNREHQDGRTAATADLRKGQRAS